MDIRQFRKSSEKVKEKINEIFDDKYLHSLARETNFIQRSTSRLEGKDFVELMTTEIITDAAISSEGLCDILLQINSSSEMSSQALNQRINSKGSVEYLKEIFKLAYQKNLDPVRENVPLGLLHSFNRVFLEDSTQCILHEKLAEKFKGSGGSAHKSALKIHLIYEFTQDVIQDLLITDGKTSDHSKSEMLLSHLQEGDLVLRDLGYFSLKSLAEIKEKNAFFLSRLFKGVDVYLSEQDDASAIDLVEYINQHFAHQMVIDLDIYLSK